MKKHLSTYILILMLIAGLSLLLYPSLSNWWNDRVQTKAIASYVESVEDMTEEMHAQMMEAAYAYNQRLTERGICYTLTEEEQEEYLSILDPTGSGIMGYIEIPSINVNLPVYHGTSEPVLNVAAGHLEWSSLPVGGTSTHAVLSGHRGLPSAKLFTNLDKLAEGDVFYIRILDELITYQVDQILIVEPSDVSPLEIVEGEDYCTLVTCTPYSVNSHRLLVRGTRAENPEELPMVTAEAFQIDSLLLAPIIAIPMLLVLLIILLLKPKKKQKDHNDINNDTNLSK